MTCTTLFLANKRSGRCIQGGRGIDAKEGLDGKTCAYYCREWLRVDSERSAHYSSDNEFTHVRATLGSLKRNDAVSTFKDAMADLVLLKIAPLHVSIMNLHAYVIMLETKYTGVLAEDVWKLLLVEGMRLILPYQKGLDSRAGQHHGCSKASTNPG